MLVVAVGGEGALAPYFKKSLALKTRLRGRVRGVYGSICVGVLIWEEESLGTCGFGSVDFTG